MNGRDDKLVDLNASTRDETTDLLKRALDVIELCYLFSIGVIFPSRFHFKPEVRLISQQEVQKCRRMKTEGKRVMVQLVKNLSMKSVFICIKPNLKLSI